MFHVVIPARYAATRLPGKPLLPIANRPLIRSGCGERLQQRRGIRHRGDRR